MRESMELCYTTRHWKGVTALRCKTTCETFVNSCWRYDEHFCICNYINFHNLRYQVLIYALLCYFCYLQSSSHSNANSWIVIGIVHYLFLQIMYLFTDHNHVYITLISEHVFEFCQRFCII